MDPKIKIMIGNNKVKYSASLTAGSLLFNEFNAILDILCSSAIEKEKERIISENILKINSESARKRTYTEIKKRVKLIDKKLWLHFSRCRDEEKKALLFYVILKSHPMVYDFQTEVVLEKFRTLDLELTKNNIGIFFVKKSTDHPEIESWSNSTREKLKNTILLILSQVNILNRNRINSLDLPVSFWREFLKYGDVWFLELSLLKKSEREKIMWTVHEAF